MKFQVTTRKPETIKTEGLALFHFEGERLAGPVKDLDKTLNSKISKAGKEGVFEGKQGQLLALDTLGKAPAERILVAGLGKRDAVTVETIRRAAGISAKAFRDAGVRNFVTTLALVDVEGADSGLLAQSVVEGTRLALYTFERFKSEKQKKKIESVTVASPDDVSALKISKRLIRGMALAEAACAARDLINLPSNIATPTYLAEEAKRGAKALGIKCSILGPKEIEKSKMGGLMAVAKGSHQPARFIIMEWMNGPKKQKPIALVGKGLTFDAGGISIKPADRMEEMKADMSGGSAVICAMLAIAALNIKANVVGLVPATENMPGGSAIKPGDVATGLSGVTMEIINTDAEGRLILSDALAYAKRYDPDCVVDIATLTGACAVALGGFASGLFGNDEELMGQLKESGEATGERLWPMPLWPEYEEQIKSEVADVKNVGPRWGGAITAAAFLKKHVTGKWAHLDVAGTAYISDKPRSYIPLGGVGLGVRLFVDFVERRLGL